MTQICSVVGCHKAATKSFTNNNLTTSFCLYHSLSPEVVEELFLAASEYKHTVLDGFGWSHTQTVAIKRLRDALDAAQGLEPEGAGK